MKLSMWFDKLCIKFLMWRKGEGFRMPSPYPIESCMYRYCKSILSGEEYTKIEAYENKIKGLIEKRPKATREDIAKGYIEALEMVYGKEMF